MILYKYYGYEAGIAALENSRLGFREPKYFNDPFELSYLNNICGDQKFSVLISDRLKSIKENVAILSLTKNPLNPLMWAHYGASHTGFVIGYDTNTPLLTDKNYNLITVNEGGVDYPDSKPLQVSTPDFAEYIHKIDLKSRSIPTLNINPCEVERELARKLYLTKHNPWAYEEEVRVVKSFDPHQHEDFSNSLHRWEGLVEHYSPSPYDSEEIIKGLKIYHEKVQIKEVYIGDRNKLLRKCSSDSNPDYTISHKAEKEQWKVFKVSVDKNSWGLKKNVIDRDVLSILAPSQGALNKVSLSASEALFLKEKLKDMSLESWDSVHVTNLGGKFFIRKNAQFK